MSYTQQSKEVYSLQTLPYTTWEDSKNYAIHRFLSPIMRSNTYLVEDKTTQQAILIDCGNTAGEIIEFVERKKLHLKAIYFTHTHYDHMEGVPALLVQWTQLNLFVGEQEHDFLGDPTKNLSYFHSAIAVETKPHLLQDQQEFSFGRLVFRAIHVPGHSPGSFCFYEKNLGVVFTGDTLFHSTIGRTDIPYASSKEELVKNLKRKILVLPEITVTLCGHGSNSTLGKERKNNPFLS